MDAVDPGQPLGQVLVETPVSDPHHDEQLGVRRRSRPRRGQHLRQVTRADPERVGGIVQRLALAEKGGGPFSLTPRTERFHVRQGAALSSELSRRG